MKQYERLRALLMSWGWPQWLAIAALSGSLAAWFMQAGLDSKTAEMAARTKEFQRKNVLTVQPGVPFAVPESLAPSEAQFNDDLKALFNIAKHAGLSFDRVDYKKETNKSPFVSRQVQMHSSQDYAHMKAFLAQVLTELPHAVLLDLQVERNDVLSAQANILVTFSLVYEAADAAKKVQP